MFPGGPQSDIQITISRPMSEFGRVTVTTKLGQLSLIMTDFQSKQLDYDRSGDRTRDLKRSSTLTIPPRHRSMFLIPNSKFHKKAEIPKLVYRLPGCVAKVEISKYPLNYEIIFLYISILPVSVYIIRLLSPNEQLY